MAMLDTLVSLSAYQATREHIFPSQTSLRWFIRKNRASLVERLALLRLAGRLVVNPTVFDEVVMTTGHLAMKAAA